jgi:hypothetical protein
MRAHDTKDAMLTVPGTGTKKRSGKAPVCEASGDASIGERTKSGVKMKDAGDVCVTTMMLDVEC